MIEERVRVKAARVDPIKPVEDIERLRQYFMSNYRHGELYALMVTVGVNTGLRAGDLLSIKVDDVINKSHLEIIEQKTGKPRKIFINKKVENSVNKYLKRYIFISDEAPIFISQKAMTLDVKAVHKLIKRGCRDLNFEGNYGSHSMRKTFAYHAYQYTKNLTLIRDLFNHSDLHVTKIYVGDDIEINLTETKDMIFCSEDEIYENLNL